MVFSDSLILNIFSVFVATIVLIIAFYKKRFRYWKDLGVEYMEPIIPFGTGSEVFLRKKTNGEHLQKYYNYLKSKNVKYGGNYNFFVPGFFPIDLDLIKRIMQTDFAHFTDHVSYVNERDDPLTAHLFALEGQKWRNLRTKLTPTFTSGKIKNMYPILVQTSDELVKVLHNFHDKKEPIQTKDISARFTTDVIGTCGFGLDCNSLADPNTEFRVYGKKLFEIPLSHLFPLIVGFLSPKIARFFRVRAMPKAGTDFFAKVIKETVDYREKTGFRRNDAMQLLLDMKVKDGQEGTEDTLTYNELAAQAFIFFFAGFETSSSVMSFALLELAINQDVQDTLRQEIKTVLEQNDNELTYTCLQEMKYLDMVVNETLRKYAPLPGLTRICTKDYHVPDSNIILKKGAVVTIPVEGIHYDPEYYPNPKKFDPTRFTEENKSKRHPFAFLPFGEGPRVCIGIRFGMMQAKIGLQAVIRNFRVKVNPKTTLPVKMDPANIFTTALEEILLDLEEIK